MLDGLAESYFRLGWLSRTALSRDDQRAIDHYSKAIALRPDYVEAINNRGLARHDSGDRAGAIADFSKAIELKPDYALAYNNRGVVRAGSGDMAGDHR